MRLFRTIRNAVTRLSLSSPAASQKSTVFQGNGRRTFINLTFIPKFLRMSSKTETEGKTENDPWLRIGDYSVFAWSISGIETSVVVKSSDGFTCCFDMGHASRESVKCDTVFISHGHMDHIAALAHHVKKRELTSCSPATYYVPEHLVKPLTDMCALYSEVNGGNTPLSNPDIQAVGPNTRIGLTRGYHAVPFPTVHRVKSQGYILYKTKKKLKEEYKGVPGFEIGAKIRAGEDVHNILVTPEVAFTGDTTFQVFTDEVNTPSPDLFRVKLLIVEATYINSDCDSKIQLDLARQWGHIHLSEIYKNADLFKNIDNILLIHFSDKYSVRYIQEKVFENIPDELRNKIHIATLAKEQYI